MIEPKLLPPETLRAIRERAEKARIVHNSGYTSAAINDRLQLLQHLGALELEARTEAQQPHSREQAKLFERQIEAFEPEGR